jgi:high-affinity nickel-transport protein
VIDALGAAALGFALGVRHAADADHVVAVAAIVARHPSLGRAARVGALWGLGHSAALFAVGGVLVAFRVAVPARLGLALELAVAAMLVVVGARNLRPGAGRASGPDAGGADRRPLVVGTVHGLAGSAAVALLALAAIPSPGWAAVYLLVFAAGTVAGMVAVTALVAAPAAFAGARARRAGPVLRMAAGALSVVFGLALARDIVVDGGLFGAAPRWTPH